MKRLVLATILLLVLAALADWLVIARAPVDPIEVGALLAATALVLGAFVALTDGACIRTLRRWAGKSSLSALALPLLMLVPYLIYAGGTRTFSWLGLLKLTAYVLAPVILLLPDRHRRRESANWRDFIAMAAVVVPVPARWLADIWTWPEELYFFLPLTAVCAGVYAFVVVRNLEDVGYRLLWRKADVVTGVGNWALFTILAIPLGYALHFIHFHPHAVAWSTLGFQFIGIYLTVAIPEELMFRGILQNLLEKTIGGGSGGRWGLLIASVIFGASHFHHPPVPNWRYCIMATLAGIFYGTAYRTRRRISSSALTHALVDTLWHFWF
ncbi:MAG TPA: CPBP family intramembrane glutamic endopeptidase [Terriglobales bacterium]